MPSALGLIFVVLIGCPLILGFVGVCVYRILRELSGVASPAQSSASRWFGELGWLVAAAIFVATFVGISALIAVLRSSSSAASNVPRGLTSMGLIVIALFLGLIVACVSRVLRGHRRVASPVQRSASGWFGELGWLSAPAIVVATFAGISASESPLASGWDSSKSVSPWRPNPPSKPSSPLAITPVPTDDRTRTTSADGLTQRPAWVDQPSTVDGIGERIAIASQQYTTREEAEQELSSRATELLLRDLQKLYPGTSPQSAWHPADEDVKRHAVKQQYVEVVERDFGNFFSPMYRVWWQVELSPEVRTEFLPAWRQGLTANRIRRVGVVVSTFVLAASLLAIYHRLNVRTQGAWQSGLKTLTSTLAALWLLAIYLVSEQWL